MRVAWLVVILVLACCQKGAVAPSGPTSIEAPKMGGAGSDVGSAGENNPRDHLAAWFVGRDKEIRACMELAPDFGVDVTTARAAVLKAFAGWKQYIEHHGIYRNELAQNQLATKLMPWGDPDCEVQGRRPRRCARPEALLPAHCDASAEIKFYLGIESAEVTHWKAQFVNPTAFVQRLTFDPKLALGRGFVWVAKEGALTSSPRFPDWHAEGRLESILLHELGHVYGNDHIPGTIMSADISEQLKSKKPPALLTSVDQCRELAACEECNYLRPLELVGMDKERAAGVKALTGKTLGPKATMILGRVQGRDWTILALKDRTESFIYELLNSGEHPVSTFESGLPVFKLVSGETTHVLPDRSFIQYVTAYEGARRAGFLIIETNLAACPGKYFNQRYPVEVSIVSENQRFELANFFTFFPQMLRPVWESEPKRAPVTPAPQPDFSDPSPPLPPPPLGAPAYPPPPPPSPPFPGGPAPTTGAPSTVL